ncbi:phosphotransferase family protein [Rhodococcus opacus]|nr:phosphotransferase family protein [Rhodococcus opacus]
MKRHCPPRGSDEHVARDPDGVPQRTTPGPRGPRGHRAAATRRREFTGELGFRSEVAPDRCQTGDTAAPAPRTCFRVVDTTRDAEFELLRLLGTTEVPVAKVHWIDDGTTFGRPSMIVERRRGAADRGALRDIDPLGIGERARLRLAGRLADTIAQVHRLDVETLGLDRVLPHPGKDPARVELERWERELDNVELEPQPALRFVARWLRDHIPPPPERLALVHGDFRPANVLVHEGEFETLLDWELAHLGDPVDDLGGIPVRSIRVSTSCRAAGSWRTSWLTTPRASVWHRSNPTGSTSGR